MMRLVYVMLALSLASCANMVEYPLSDGRVISVRAQDVPRMRYSEVVNAHATELAKTANAKGRPIFEETTPDGVTRVVYDPRMPDFNLPPMPRSERTFGQDLILALAPGAINTLDNAVRGYFAHKQSEAQWDAFNTLFEGGLGHDVDIDIGSGASGGAGVAGVPGGAGGPISVSGDWILAIDRSGVAGNDWNGSGFRVGSPGEFSPSDSANVLQGNKKPNLQDVSDTGTATAPDNDNVGLLPGGVF